MIPRYFNKCPHCGNKITTSFFYHLIPKTDIPDICPFCGKSMKEFSEYPEEILRQIIIREGREILKQPRRLEAFLDDLIPNRQKEKLSFLFATQHGLGLYFFKMASASSKNKNIQRSKAKAMLCEQLGLTEERTKFIMESYQYATGDISSVDIEYRKTEPYMDRDHIYYNLGELYHEKAKSGDMISDYGIYFFRLSSKAGNKKAFYRIFQLYDDANQYNSPQEALAVREQIAREYHDLKASYLTALHYSYGIGTGMDLPKSAYYWQTARYYSDEAACEFYLRQLAGLLPISNKRKALSMLHILAENYLPAKLLYEDYQKHEDVNRMALLFAKHCSYLDDTLNLDVFEYYHVDSDLFWLGLPYKSGNDQLAFDAIMILYESENTKKQALAVEFFNEFLEKAQNPDIKKKTASILIHEFEAQTHLDHDEARLEYLQSF